MSYQLTAKRCQFNGNFAYVSSATMQRMKDDASCETPTLPPNFHPDTVNRIARMVVALGLCRFYYPCDTSCLLQPDEIMLSPCIMEENGLANGDVIDVFAVGYGLKYFSGKPLLRSISVAFAMTGPTVPIAELQLARRRLVEMFGWQFVPVRAGQTLFFERRGVRGGRVRSTEPPLPEGDVGRITDETRFLFLLDVDGALVSIDELRDRDDPDLIAKPTAVEMLRRGLESLSISAIREVPPLDFSQSEVQIGNDYERQ